MIKGKNLILSLNGTAIAAAKNGSIAVDTSFINVCSPISGAWEEVLPTVHKWSASSDGLVSDPQYIDSLLQMQINKTPLTLRFSMGGAGNRQGTCYIAHIEQTGSVGNLAKYSIQLQGSGALATPVDFKDLMQSADSMWILYNGQELEIHGCDNTRTVLAAPITISTNRKVVISGTGAWGISGDGISRIDTYFHYEDSDGLNHHMEACGQGATRVSLTPGTYTMLKNNFENISMVIE